jgi:hypothetical protein
MDQFRPISREFTTLLAERPLLLVTGEVRTPVTLRIGVPVQDVETVDDRDWRCPVEFIGVDGPPPPPGVGVDALQALTHALKIAHLHAALYERQAGGRFHWLDEPGHGLSDIVVSS